MKASFKVRSDLSLSSSEKERSNRQPKSRESGYYDQTSGSSKKNASKRAGFNNADYDYSSSDSGTKKKEKENKGNSILKKGRDKNPNTSNRVLTFRDTNIGLSPGEIKANEPKFFEDGRVKSAKERLEIMMRENNPKREKNEVKRNESPSEEKKLAIRQKQLEKEREIFSRIVTRSKEKRLVRLGDDSNDSYISNHSEILKRQKELNSSQDESPRSRGMAKAKDEFSDLERRINRLEREIDSNLKRKEGLNQIFQEADNAKEKRLTKASDHSFEIDRKINKIKNDLELGSSHREKGFDLERKQGSFCARQNNGFNRRPDSVSKTDSKCERGAFKELRRSSQESVEPEASEIKRHYREEGLLEKLKRKRSKAKRELEVFRREQERKKMREEVDAGRSKRVTELKTEKSCARTNPIVDESIKILKENEVLKQKIRELEKKELQANQHLANVKERSQISGMKSNIPRPISRSRSKTPEIRPSTTAGCRGKSVEAQKKFEEEELEKIAELDNALKSIARDGDAGKLEKQIELLKTIERIKRKLRRAIAIKVTQATVQEKKIKQTEKKTEEIKKARQSKKEKAGSSFFKSAADVDVSRNPGSRHCSNCSYLLSKGVPTNFCTNHNNSNVSGF